MLRDGVIWLKYLHHRHTNVCIGTSCWTRPCQAKSLLHLLHRWCLEVVSGSSCKKAKLGDGSRDGNESRLKSTTAFVCTSVSRNILDPRHADVRAPLLVQEIAAACGRGEGMLVAVYGRCLPCRLDSRQPCLTAAHCSLAAATAWGSLGQTAGLDIVKAALKPASWKASTIARDATQRHSPPDLERVSPPRRTRRCRLEAFRKVPPPCAA